MVAEEGAAATTTTRRPLTSTVWRSFRINYPATGGPPTATCGKCGQTLRAGSSNGTSHLRRHTRTKRCRQRAAELRRQRQLLTAPAADDDEPPPPGDQEDYSMSPPALVEEEFYVVDGIDIPNVYDELDAKGLVNIDHVAALPQAASASISWFLKKQKERKGAESKKRCAPEDESGLDLSAQADFSSRDKRTLPNSA